MFLIVLEMLLDKPWASLFCTIEFCNNCDWSAHYPGSRLEAQGLKWGQMNRKACSSGNRKLNWFNAAIFNSVRSGYACMQLLTICIMEAISLLFETIFLLCFLPPFRVLSPPSIFAGGLFGRRKGRGVCQLWALSGAKERELGQRRKQELLVGYCVETQLRCCTGMSIGSEGVESSDRWR